LLQLSGPGAKRASADRRATLTAMLFACISRTADQVAAERRLSTGKLISPIKSPQSIKKSRPSRTKPEGAKHSDRRRCLWMRVRHEASGRCVGLEFGERCPTEMPVFAAGPVRCNKTARCVMSVCFLSVTPTQCFSYDRDFSRPAARHRT
jgi:hypothetical protein